jgi:mycothiol conjugate amidase Mca
MSLTLMAVHAHPDDETITTGGILARYSAEGVSTIVVTCTGGEVGEISDPTLATPETLAEVRARELREALRILGVRHHEFLGYRDSGMMGTPANEHPACFWQADLDAATGKLVALVRRLKPDVIIAYNENGDYGHPDHINAHRIAVAAFNLAGDPSCYPEQGLAPWEPKKLYYSAWPRSQSRRMQEIMQAAGVEPDPHEAENDAEVEEWATPDELITTRIDISTYIDAKLDALAAHQTQMGPETWFGKVPRALWRQVWSTEYFVRARSRVPVPDDEDDLFAGLRAARIPSPHALHREK